MKSLYSMADEEIRVCISEYLSLMGQTQGLSNLKQYHIDTDRKRIIIISGLNIHDTNLSKEDVISEWQRRQAIPFDVETAITSGVYLNIRAVGAKMLDSVEKATDGFSTFDPKFISDNPAYLPILQHLSGVFSKAALKRIIGSVSDNSVSKPAAQRLSNLLEERVNPESVSKGEILRRLDSTLEGIVRDLVGRVLLESIAQNALKESGIAFLRENEYENLSGVVYDFRADFVIPDNISPLVPVRRLSESLESVSPDTGIPA